MNSDDFCNFFINWLPIPKVRKWIYTLLNMKIHPTAHIMRNCQFVSMKDIVVGERSIIGHDCLLDAKGGINIGKDVNISSYAKVLTAKHIVDDPFFMGINKPIIIGDRVWVASAAIILPGIEIGEGAIIAAGSVVTKNIAAFSIVGGVPAKKIANRKKELQYQLHSRPSRFL